VVDDSPGNKRVSPWLQESLCLVGEAASAYDTQEFFSAKETDLLTHDYALVQDLPEVRIE